MNKIKPEELVRGVIKYIDTEVIHCIDNKFTQVMFKAFVVSSESKMTTYVKAIEEFLKSRFAIDFLEADDSGIEIEVFLDSLRKAINECGEIVIKIPPVRFLSPEWQELSFNATDITKLKQYLTNEIKGV